QTFTPAGTLSTTTTPTSSTCDGNEGKTTAASSDTAKDVAAPSAPATAWNLLAITPDPTHPKRLWIVTWGRHTSRHARDGGGSRRRAPMLVGSRTRDLPGLPRHRVGVRRHGRPAPVREAVPRGLPIGPVLADDPPQARGVPRGVRRIRPRASRPLRRHRRGTSPVRPRHRPPRREDPVCDQQRRPRPRAARRVWVPGRLLLAVRRSPLSRPRDDPGDHAGLRRPRRGPETPWMDVRRPHHGLLVH